MEIILDSVDLRDSVQFNGNCYDSSGNFTGQVVKKYIKGECKKEEEDHLVG